MKQLTDQQTEFRRDIALFEKQAKNRDMSRSLPLVHHFAHDVYGRELHIPKNCRLTGKIHRHSCINVILKGRITVVTEEGEVMVKAPQVIISPPGTKRGGFAHEDTIWMTFHHTEQTDPAKVEDEVIAESFYALENEPAPVYPPAGLNYIEQQTLKHLLEKQKQGTLLTSPSTQEYHNPQWDV